MRDGVQGIQVGDYFYKLRLDGLVGLDGLDGLDGCKRVS